ncbi:MAG: nucleotidyltransferase domain-containing protein [Armatimonadota bacterium]
MNQYIEIIKVFYNDPIKVCSIHEISKLLSKPYGTTYNYVQSLIKEQVLKAVVQGKATLCSLNFENQKAIELLSIFSVYEKEYFTKKQGVLSQALNELAVRVNEKSNYGIFALVLFGSTVTGAATAKSDIDLFFISLSKDKYDKIIENECNVLRMSYGRDINSIITEPKMYINMLKEREENVAKQILKNKVIYFGANKFWELTFGGLK